MCAAAIYEAVTALEQGSVATSMLALGIVAFCGLAFASSVAVIVCSLTVRQDSFATAIDAGQIEPMVGALSRGAIGTSIFMICLAAFLSAALHIYLN